MNGLSDLDVLRPQKPRAGRGKAKPQPKVASAFATVRRLRSRATLVIASAGFSAIMVGILCNALLLQKGHHPAPLFATAAPPAAPKPRVVEAPAPVPAPVAAAAPEAPAEVVPAPVVPAVAHRATAPATVAHAPHRLAAKPVSKGRDDIARLLGGGAKPAKVDSAPLQLHKVRPGHPAAKAAVRVTPSRVPVDAIASVPAVPD